MTTAASTVVTSCSIIDYATDMGVSISSNSWGSPVHHQEILDAIARAGQKGHLFVSSAGNFAEDIDPGAFPRYPAGYELDNILSVAATSDDDLLANFSDWGMVNVDLAAPGREVLTTDLRNS